MTWEAEGIRHRKPEKELAGLCYAKFRPVPKGCSSGINGEGELRGN